MGYPTLALHVAPDEEGAERMQAYWAIWGAHLPLETLVAPYRAVVATIANYLSALHRQQPELTLTVMVPELLPARSWQRILHNGTERRLRAALRDHYGAVLVWRPFTSKTAEPPEGARATSTSRNPVRRGGPATPRKRSAKVSA